MIRVLPPIAVAALIALSAYLLRPQPVKPEPPVVRVLASHTEPRWLDVAREDLEGCFAEWSERVADHYQAVDVRFSVTPEGVAYDGHATGTESSALAFCVSEAFLRQRYPQGMRYEVAVRTGWDRYELDISGVARDLDRDE